MAQREEKAKQMQAAAQQDGFVHVAEAQEERASAIVYAKIVISHFQIILQFRKLKRTNL